MRSVLRARPCRTLAAAALALVIAFHALDAGVARAQTPAPIVAGEWPDPSVITDGSGYTAVTTSNGWAPTFRILRSDDRRTWRIAGSVFRRPPRWARTDFWAPEITKLRDRYAVFYSALPRRRGGWYCLGVATAPAATGPYRDKGAPLRCNRYGSIDPFPVRDANGVLYLIWKEDGNEFQRPTPLFAQQLSEDGQTLLGRPTELLRNTEQWEGSVLEAPAVIRRDNRFYLFYSANLCCTRRCVYAVGVARAPNLLGPWEKYPGNPILRSGNGWRCPGHTAVIADAAGGYTAFYHAYRPGARMLAGRQLVADGVGFGADGWPRIGAGAPPRPLRGAAPTSFSDRFRGRRLEAPWEWLTERTPRIRVRDGLTLTASARGGRRVDNAVLGRRVRTPNYVATAIVDRRALRGQALAGLASYRNGFTAIGGSGFEAIGVAVGRDRLIVWRRRGGRFQQLLEARAPRASLVHLRLSSRGRRLRFRFSRDGRRWRTLGPELRTPIEENARLALTTGGRVRAVARFVRASLREDSAP